MRRRQILKVSGAAIGAASLAGCTVNLGDAGSGSTDDDADESDPEENTEPSGSSDTSDSTDSSDQSNADEGDNSDSSDSSDSSDDNGIETVSETLSISSDDDFVRLRMQPEQEAIITWSVENELSSDLDFDVFLLSEPEYSIYQQNVNGDNREFRYIQDGTIQGIRESAEATVRLDPGTYYLVVDNTDIGDAGDFGEESTRRVTLSVEGRYA